jgi:carbon-monoxide dehydrogenase medium subunit
MKPPPFAYVRPETRRQALDVLDGAAAGYAKVLAGGQSLVPLLRLRLARPELLVDVGRLEELRCVRTDPDGSIRIGAATTQNEVERDDGVRTSLPLLAEALPLVAHAAIRSRGTIGGSLAHADPAAELPAVMLALDAELLLESARESRIVPADSFFVSYFTTALADHELLTEIRIPAPGPTEGTAILEAARRRGDFALAGVAVRLGMSADRCTLARVVVFGVGQSPLRLRESESALVDSRLTDPELEQAADAIEAAIQPASDVHASAEYRSKAAAVLCGRALVLARERLIQGGAQA